MTLKARRCVNCDAVFIDEGQPGQGLCPACINEKRCNAVGCGIKQQYTINEYCHYIKIYEYGQNDKYICEEHE